MLRCEYEHRPLYTRFNIWCNAFLSVSAEGGGVRIVHVGVIVVGSLVLVGGLFFVSTWLDM